MKRIHKVAVLGSGVMGAGIAAHLANAGLSVILFDMPAKEGAPDAVVRANRDALLKAKPSPLYLKDSIKRIDAATFDELERVGECDWVIEVVVENLDIKKSLLTRLAPLLGPEAILSTNTSGLSVNAMAEVLPAELRKRFLVTHFFNPARYMRLLEIVPCADTDPAILKGMADFVDQRLGKGVVYAKDTPNFIGNRIGVYSIFNAFRHMVDLEMTVEEVDAVAGPATARPRSAAFRTADLVGLDTLMYVGENSYRLLPEDDEREIFQSPEFLQKLVKDGALGNKAKRGFYRKEQTAEGRAIFFYDYQSGEYRPAEKPKFASVAAGKMIDNPGERLKALILGNDKGAEFAWRNIRDSLLYAFKRIPEIADDVLNIDRAMRWGFNWEIGPFEMFDALGVAYVVDRAKKDGISIPAGLEGIERFYRIADGVRSCFDLQSREYKALADDPGTVNLTILKSAGKEVERTANASILDLGDGVFGLEFHSKMNAIGGDILSLTRKAVARAEAEGVGLVVGNQGATFSAGANLMLLAVAAAEGAYDDIALMVRSFQQATMALKLAKVPVVAAPFGMVLGGGCEYCLHSSAVVAHPETYMGLVEVGVGILPAGGGTKEMALRAAELAGQFGTDVSPYIFKYFKQIGMASVSTSADELFGMGYLRQGDKICMNLDRLIAEAKRQVLALAPTFRPRELAVDIPAAGRSVAASIRSSLWNLVEGGFATEHDALIGNRVAHVMTGGDVAAGTLITEEYLLELEREGFMKLCGERKTMERIQHMLKKGKPLRN